ncbi:MAG: hypothetical protein SFV18_18425 [Bryobacteraceae bacterium]|nr:hypothetical protein [Bryobacteraceae bacterium]
MRLLIWIGSLIAVYPQHEFAIVASVTQAEVSQLKIGSATCSIREVVSGLSARRAALLHGWKFLPTTTGRHLWQVLFNEVRSDSNLHLLTDDLWPDLTVRRFSREWVAFPRQNEPPPYGSMNMLHGDRVDGFRAVARHYAGPQPTVLLWLSNSIYNYDDRGSQEYFETRLEPAMWTLFESNVTLVPIAYTDPNEKRGWEGSRSSQWIASIFGLPLQVFDASNSTAVRAVFQRIRSMTTIRFTCEDAALQRLRGDRPSLVVLNQKGQVIHKRRIGPRPDTQRPIHDFEKSAYRVVPSMRFRDAKAVRSCQGLKAPEGSGYFLIDGYAEGCPNGASECVVKGEAVGFYPGQLVTGPIDVTMSIAGTTACLGPLELDAPRDFQVYVADLRSVAFFGLRTK